MTTKFQVGDRVYISPDAYPYDETEETPDRCIRGKIYLVKDVQEDFFRINGKEGKWEYDWFFLARDGVVNGYSLDPFRAAKINSPSSRRFTAVEAVENAINHPAHYTSGPTCEHCGKTIECIIVAQHHPFTIGNVIKYLWRAGLKTADGLEDFKKARWYLNRAIESYEDTLAKVVATDPNSFVQCNDVNPEPYASFPVCSFPKGHSGAHEWAFPLGSNGHRMAHEAMIRGQKIVGSKS